jgi:signal transduction histidine kinase
MSITMQHAGSQEQVDTLTQQAQEAATSDLPHAEKLATEAYTLATDQGYAKGRADALYVMAMVNYYRSEYSACYEKLIESLTIYAVLNDEAGRVQKMTMLGGTYRQLGDLAAALEVHQEQLAILERVDNPRLRARVLNSIGGIYHLLKKPDESIRTLEPALAIMRELGQKQDEAVILGNLCDAYSSRGDFDHAIQLGKEALIIVRENGIPPILETTILSALANACTRAGHYPEADWWYQSALQISTASGNQKQYASTLCELCELELQRGNPQKALEYGLRAIENLPKEAETTLYQVFEWIAQAYHKLGNHEQAYHFLRRYHTLSEALFTERSDQRLRLLEVRYKTDAAQREADFYQQRNRELETQTSRIQAYFGRLNQLKDDLLNTTSHNLKNPLSTIRTAAYLLGRMPELTFSKGSEYVETITRQTDIMALLISDVLELAKLETGRAIQKRETLLNSLLRDCVTNFNTQAAAKNIALVLELPDESVRFDCDPKLITRALHNLLSNAVKYTPRDGTVTLRAEATPNTLHISVRDTGVGIPADALPHIFERFYRVKEHNAFSEGSGLGLSLVQTIIEQHGGTIHAQSQPGQGSTFSIQLPRQSPEQPSEQPSERAG